MEVRDNEQRTIAGAGNEELREGLRSVHRQYFRGHRGLPGLSALIPHGELQSALANAVLNHYLDQPFRAREHENLHQNPREESIESAHNDGEEEIP